MNKPNAKQECKCGTIGLYNGPLVHAVDCPFKSNDPSSRLVNQPAQRESWEDEFDKLWPNLYTVVPMLGQGDARRAVKDFIRKERSRVAEGLLKEVKDGIDNSPYGGLTYRQFNRLKAKYNLPEEDTHGE